MPLLVENTSEEVIKCSFNLFNIILSEIECEQNWEKVPDDLKTFSTLLDLRSPTS